MELEFPIEFVVNGTAVSLQAKRRASVDQWKDRVKEHSRVALPEAHFATEEPIAVTLYYFPDTEMQGDVDNIVKPVLDALCRHIYVDDRQVERVSVQKFEPGRVFQFGAPSSTLETALSGRKPLLYVRLSNDVSEELK
ncbi:RusA family crossover junction endodeoxyribonuclease [Sinorhizobium meliloti]|uniref:RusA family crossover junction endodeoxyribonuclease n=1 Tax=Rhizobium meliloti TaxID=382 RepID=UPI000FD1CB87|nr:RusA family crossover junction endodeoxyribonuclease [Sinorhizobium meliloti]RVO43464.1 RusA family crossover junction endodeoxyribonuclease [Sinorhizobium meliloti]